MDLTTRCHGTTAHYLKQPKPKYDLTSTTYYTLIISPKYYQIQSLESELINLLTATLFPMMTRPKKPQNPMDETPLPDRIKNALKAYHTAIGTLSIQKAAQRYSI